MCLENLKRVSRKERKKADEITVYKLFHRDAISNTLRSSTAGQPFQIGKWNKANIRYSKNIPSVCWSDKHIGLLSVFDNMYDSKKWGPGQVWECKARGIVYRGFQDGFPAYLVEEVKPIKQVL